MCYSLGCNQGGSVSLWLRTLAKLSLFQVRLPNSFSGFQTLFFSNKPLFFQEEHLIFAFIYLPLYFSSLTGSWNPFGFSSAVTLGSVWSVSRAMTQGSAYKIQNPLSSLLHVDGKREVGCVCVCVCEMDKPCLVSGVCVCVCMVCVWERGECVWVCVCAQSMLGSSLYESIYWVCA